MQVAKRKGFRLIIEFSNMIQSIQDIGMTIEFFKPFQRDRPLWKKNGY